MSYQILTVEPCVMTVTEELPSRDRYESSAAWPSVRRIVLISIVYAGRRSRHLCPTAVGKFRQSFADGFESMKRRPVCSARAI